MASLVRAAALANFSDIARQYGIDPQPALRQAGIDPRALADPEMRIPAAATNQLLEDAAAISGCETFGLRMGELRRLSDFGALSLLIAHQPTLRAALNTILTYRRMLNESLLIDVEESADLVIIREALLIDGAVSVRQGHELLIATMFRMCRGLLGPGWRPTSVNFTHAPPTDPNVHRRLFGLNLEFNSEFNGVVLRSADLDRPNPAADPAFAEYAKQFVETLPNAQRDGTLYQVRKAVYQLLPMGRASIPHVAQSLGLNPRTLQRRLSAEGAQFGEVVDGVRRDLVSSYLANRTLPLTQVAGMLGFGQLSSFTRWYTVAFGAPPSRSRNHR